MGGEEEEDAIQRIVRKKRIRMAIALPLARGLVCKMAPITSGRTGMETINSE